MTGWPHCNDAVLCCCCLLLPQVEEVNNPSLRGKPLAVTQKYLVVTANGVARAAGVTK